MQYKIKERLIKQKNADQVETPFVEVLTKEAYRNKYPHLVKNHLLLRSMESISHCKVDLFKKYILGTFSIPQKEMSAEVDWNGGFYMDSNKLILIGDVEKISWILERVEEHQIMDMETPAQALFEFMEALVVDDVDFIDSLEKRLDDKEEEMVEDVNEIPKDFEQYILRRRKELIVWNRYYKQLCEMAQILESCPNGIVDAGAKEMFAFFSHKVERLCADTQMLREYTLQLRDMYQSRIDVRQNKVVQFLTVVTTIFMPLTLITGWYGMNFIKMPELEWVHGYTIVIILTILIILAEWHIFKKKKWL